MACTNTVSASITKPPRRFSADVLEDDETGKQQVAQSASWPSAAGIHGHSEVNNPTPTELSGATIAFAAAGSLDGGRMASDVHEAIPHFLQENVVKPIANLRSACAIDEDELELWKLSHRDVLQRLMDLTDRYSDLEVKHKELNIKYQQLVRHVNSKTASGSVEGISGEDEEIDSRVIGKAVYSMGSHDNESASAGYGTIVDEYGFLVQHREVEPITLPANIRKDLANDRLNPSVFYSAESDSVKWAVQNEASSSEKLNRSQRISSFNLNNHIADAHQVKFEKLLASHRSMPAEQFHGRLKHLMRYGSPTPELRTKTWQYCINYHLYRRRCNEYVLTNNKQYYQSLLESRIRTLTSASFSANNNTLDTGAAKQIGLDLLRTFPNNIYFKDISSPTITKMERVLTAFSKHNVQIGYTQGMNRLAGIALLCLPEESDAFWALVTITEHLLPGYYGDTMRELLIDQRVFAEFVTEKMPRLAVHLKVHFIDINLFSFNWFLVVFVDSTLPCVFMPLWDAFMLEGKKVLFRYALAILKYWERELVALDSCSVLNNFLRTMGERIDTPAAAARLRRIAFGEMNPFPARLIERKRRTHRMAVEAELASMQCARDEIRRAAATAAAVEVGIDTLNLLAEQRIEREQQHRNNYADDGDAAEDGYTLNPGEPSGSEMLLTNLDSVSLYYAAATEVKDSDDDNDSWHSVQSSYNYERFEDSGGSPYCRRRGHDEETESHVLQAEVDTVVGRLTESAPDLSLESLFKQETAARRRSASCSNIGLSAAYEVALSDRDQLKALSSIAVVRCYPFKYEIEVDEESKLREQGIANRPDHEYFSVRCPSQISVSRSDSTAAGPTPIPPPRKSHRERQLSASPTRLSRLLSRATSLRSSFGGNAATKKTMLNRAMSNAASRHGEFFKRKITPKQQEVFTKRVTQDEVVCVDKKCENYNKPLLFTHAVKDSGLSTFYYKLLRKCHCAMDVADRPKNLDDIREITPTSSVHFDFPAAKMQRNNISVKRTMSSHVTTPAHGSGTSVFFHPKYYDFRGAASDNIDNVADALPDDANNIAENMATNSSPPTRRASLAVTLRSAVTQRLGQLITPGTSNTPPYVITGPEEGNRSWRSGMMNAEDSIGSARAIYKLSPETTAALVAVQEANEASIFIVDHNDSKKAKQSSSNRQENWADNGGQKVSDSSSRFILKFPPQEAFGYSDILPSIKPIDF